MQDELELIGRERAAPLGLGQPAFERAMAEADRRGAALAGAIFGVARALGSGLGSTPLSSNGLKAPFVLVC
eukprot:6393119-Pyramimonas_sp.AAC.1